MRKLAGTVLAAMAAVLAFGAIMASTASAASHPLFLTASKQTLLFLGEGSKPILHGLQAGLQATVECEKVLIHGLILHESSLAHLLPLLFENSCVQKINGGANEACEPGHITTKTILAELGLLSSTNKTVVILLAPDDGTTTFTEFTCGGHKTTVGGTVVGEIPATNKIGRGEPQYNTELTELEVKFETTAPGSDQQKITEIELLGTPMKGQELKIEGFLGERAAQEATTILKSDGNIKIDV